MTPGSALAWPLVLIALLLLLPTLEVIARAERALAGIPGSARVVTPEVIRATPDNLVAWLLDPPAFREHTAMPRVGLTEAEARHLAAYLYTLR